MLQDYFERIIPLFDSYIKENWGKGGGGLEVSTFSISYKSQIENQVRDFMCLRSSGLSLRFQINFLHPFFSSSGQRPCEVLASVVSHRPLHLNLLL